MTGNLYFVNIVIYKCLNLLHKKFGKIKYHWNIVEMLQLSIEELKFALYIRIKY